MAEVPISAQTFWEPKAGRSGREYEDAAAVDEATWPVRAAVADGATESVFARSWAEMLVARHVTGEAATPDAFAEQLPTWQTRWHEAIGDQLDTLPWYAAEKVEQGAFATFLGLTLRADQTWKAIAVGDCNLLQLRDGAFVCAWPRESVDQFTHRPALVPSRATESPIDLVVQEGTWSAGDTFLLATDAVAAWLLRAGPTATGLDDEAFRAHVEEARSTGTLRNDDATLVTLHL